jgi:glucose/arabinose dehydrogenase
VAQGSDVTTDVAEPTCAPIRGTVVALDQLATTQGPAILVTSPPGDPRNFVVEQEGRIRILDEQGLRSDAFLDISEDAGGPVHLGNTEQGLLGLAFDPKFATNGTFYVFYTPRQLLNVIAKYQVQPGDPQHADPHSGVIVLAIDDYADTHNGGMLEFGADGYLYAGTGDGGKAGDPYNNGQNPSALLGKILRLDVDHPAPGKPYGIPPGNPYADAVGGAPEVFMVGLRNPWRFTFDTQTADLWIGDVGQDHVEEIDVIPAGGGAGLNLGWSMYEGSACYKPPCDAAGKTMPDLELLHSAGWCAVIGGQVYRGACYPDLQGTYFFTDYCKGTLATATRDASGALVVNEPSAPALPTPSSLHAGARGDLFVTTTTCCGGAQNGSVWRLRATP